MLARIPRHLLLITAGILFFTSMAQPVTARDVFWADRGNRFEGVITDRNVSGGLFELLGIQTEYEDKLDRSASNLTVSFSLPAPTTINLKVWEPHTNYWMVPKQKDFPSGHQSFSWPVSMVLEPLGLDLAKLKVLVTDTAETMYYPAHLFTGIRKIGTKRYRFTFESKGGFELKGTISRQIGNMLIPVKFFDLLEDYPGILEIEWDGLDDKGGPVQSGIMHLQLEGFLYLADSDSDLVFNLQFWHAE